MCSAVTSVHHVRYLRVTNIAADSWDKQCVRGHARAWYPNVFDVGPDFGTGFLIVDPESFGIVVDRFAGTVPDIWASVVDPDFRVGSRTIEPDFRILGRRLEPDFRLWSQTFELGAGLLSRTFEFWAGVWNQTLDCGAGLSSWEPDF